MTGTPNRWPRVLMRVTLALAAVCVVVGGLAAVGNLARDSLGPADRYKVDFAAIDCPAPPGQSREDFLGEVQYTGAFGDGLSMLDPALPDKLRAAFAKHPAVADVKRIAVRPPKQITVELTFHPKPE